MDLPRDDDRPNTVQYAGIRLVGAPLALLADAVLLLGSVLILRGLRWALALGGAGALALALWGWRHPVLRNVRKLPVPAGYNSAHS